MLQVHSGALRCFFYMRMPAPQKESQSSGSSSTAFNHVQRSFAVKMRLIIQLNIIELQYKCKSNTLVKIESMN